jgi:hypothetical protein
MEPSTNIRTGIRDPEVTLVGSVQAPVEAKVKTRTEPGALCWICAGASTEEAVSIPPCNLGPRLSGFQDAATTPAALGHLSVNPAQNQPVRPATDWPGRAL